MTGEQMSVVFLWLWLGSIAFGYVTTMRKLDIGPLVYGVLGPPLAVGVLALALSTVEAFR